MFFTAIMGSVLIMTFVFIVAFTMTANSSFSELNIGKDSPIHPDEVHLPKPAFGNTLKGGGKPKNRTRTINDSNNLTIMINFKNFDPGEYARWSFKFRISRVLADIR